MSRSSASAPAPPPGPKTEHPPAKRRRAARRALCMMDDYVDFPVPWQSSRGELAEIFVPVDPRRMAVGEPDVEGVLPHGADRGDLQIRGDRRRVQPLLAGPFVHTGGARAGRAQVARRVLAGLPI